MSDNVFQQIKDRVTCVQYAQLLGWDIKKSGDRTYSLDKGNNKSALVVHNEYWHDFKTGQGGDVIDLCAMINHGGDKGEAVKELSRVANIEPSEKQKQWLEYTQNLCNLSAKWNKQLTQEHIDYLHSRKITDETIERLRIGFNNGRIIIPYYKNNHVCYWIGRGEKPKYFKPKLDGLNENIPWGMHTLSRESKELLVIAEGAFDALSFDQEGFSVLATMGGHFSKAQLKQVLDIAKTFEEVFLCFDSDEAGNKFLSDLSQILFTNKIKFSCNQLIDDKDVSDYYTRGGSLKDLVANKKDGLKFICEKIKDKDEFKTFIKQVGRYTGKAELCELFELVNNNFSKTWLDQIKKQALSAPTEDMIAKEIVAKYKLKHHAGMFYEYQNGVWQMQQDFVIKSYIADELGHYVTGAKLNTICNVLMVKVADETLFNRQNVFNFRNGVLNLDTGEFSEHSEVFYSTMQVNYKYVPDIQPKLWINFLNDLFQNNQDKIALVQEMLGYILFSDVSLQKCFYLLGSGSNGKSKLLEIISMLFQSCKLNGLPSNPSNISSLEMSELTERFERINLLNSILNISSETSTDVAGAETIFKKTVVNETINGAWKGKDSISFIPRAKWIIACNEYIQARDASDGFDRRIMFIKFDVKFCDNPIYQNERKSDPQIVSKIKPELSAIFNWVYDGYKRLRQNMQFTQTEEQAEIKNEFRTIVNPIMGFIAETNFIADGYNTDFISIRSLYNLYTSYCKHSGHYALSYNKFSISFKNVVISYFQDRFEYKKTDTQRGYRIVSPF